MGFEEEVLETEFGEHGIEPVKESALRKPKPLGPASERFLKSFHGNAQLQADCRRVRLVRRQERMRPHTSEQRELADFFQLFESRNNLLAKAVFPVVNQGELTAVIEIHHRQKFMIVLQARLLLFKEVHLHMQVTRKLVQQDAVGEHRQQRRRNAQVERSGNSPFLQAPKHLHQGEVRF